MSALLTKLRSRQEFIKQYGQAVFSYKELNEIVVELQQLHIRVQHQQTLIEALSSTGDPTGGCGGRDSMSQMPHDQAP